MENLELIDASYSEAVKELTEDMLKDETKWYKYVMSLPEYLQVVYTVIIFHKQVLNGGLHQYFSNGYGLFGYVTLNNLLIIKANDSMSILKKSLDEVNKEGFSESEFRNRIFYDKFERIVDFDDELVQKLDDLDNEYYSLDFENVIGLLGNYLRTMKAW